MSSGLLVHGGAVATLAGDHGLGLVDAIAVVDGRVTAAGTLESVGAPTGARRLHLEPDDVVLPGLTDAHVHVLEAALAAERVDLTSAPTLEDGLLAVGNADGRLRDRGAWLEGGGWDPTRWGRWPSAADLERIAPGRRIALWAHDHHALWVSDAALAAAGIDERTADPDGGVIRREDGRVTGVLHEHASRLVTARIPPPAGDRLDRALEAWARMLLALGVVAVHDMGPLTPDATLGGAFASVGRLDAAGRLPIRVHAGIREESLDEAIGRGLRTGAPITGEPRGRARVGWWKRFADGSLGSRTAYLRDPYENAGRASRDPAYRGLALVDPAELSAGVKRAARHGIVTAVHAIGDAAADLAIDALEEVAGVEEVARPDDAGGEGAGSPQPRIEHAQLLADEQLRRLARTTVALSMQPVHVRSDAPSLGAAWGDRTRRLGYRWRSAKDAGIRVAFGTDTPVEPPSPWPGLAAALDRTIGVGTATPYLDPTEALSLDDAIRAWTVEPALLAGERDRGRLVPGHRADFVVLRVPPGSDLEESLRAETARPVLVAIDGEVVFEA